MYHVIGSGGSKYGPADVNTLKQWVTENRVTPTTMLEDAVTGRQFPASELTELFPQAASTPDYPGAVAPGGIIEPPKSNPSTPYGGTTVNSPTSSPYSSSPSNYPRDTNYQSPEAQQHAMWGWILSSLSIVCCWCITGPLGIYFAVKARNAGYEKGDMLFAWSIIAPILGLVLGIVINSLGFINQLGR